MTEPPGPDTTHDAADAPWFADGHATDGALAAIADGEGELVPHDVRAHVDACVRCGAELETMALLAATVHEALAPRAAAETRAPAPVPRALPETAAPPRPFPLALVAAGLGVAALGALPRLVAGHDRPDLEPPVDATLRAFVAVRDVLASAPPPSASAHAAALWTAAAFLFAVALVVRRLADPAEETR